jgi:hypothetical protein
MTVPKTISDLKELINNAVEESQQLEYKAAQGLLNLAANKDIAKDVSAMANASGGVIIYGIKEHNSADKKHLPESITPVRRTDFSKERLEQIINSNISPKIEGLLVHPIPLENPNEVAYVVEVPQSQTAHQSLKDFIYYRRYNFEILPMQDYEIRDVMNRLKYPKIEMNFELIKYTFQVRKASQYLGGKDENKEQTTLTLKVRPFNVGNQYAQYVNYFLELPLEVFDRESAMTHNKISDSTVQYYGENTLRDILDVDHTPWGSTKEKLGPSRFDPILPGLRGRPESIQLKPDIILNNFEIKWKVYADNAPMNSGVIKMTEIKLTHRNN